MTSYLRKYVTAVASAKDYIAQWSSEHVFADEPLIIPFPTLAIFDAERRVWSVHIKAWVYLPFQSKPLTNYLPSLPNLWTSAKPKENGSNEVVTKTIGEEDRCRKTDVPVSGVKGNETDESDEDDIYHDALGRYLHVWR